MQVVSEHPHALIFANADHGQIVAGERALDGFGIGFDGIKADNAASTRLQRYTGFTLAAVGFEFDG